jgi:hypothetical protein
MARLLEPIAVKKASLITGVAAGYFTPVLERNPHLKIQAVSGAMPYGGEVLDHAIVHTLEIEPYLFQKKSQKFQLVYAGAILPKAYKPLEKILACIVANPSLFAETEFHFIGTGKTTEDANGFNIKSLAQKYGLWQKVIFEYPQRIPYLDVLVHLNIADGIFILGSTEPHYTPSKVYQGVLSGKSILAVLHKDSTAGAVINTTKSGVVLSFEADDLNKIKDQFPIIFQQYLSVASGYHVSETTMEAFDNYSARNVTKRLAELLEKTVKATEFLERTYKK